MKLQGLNFHLSIAALALAGCASTSSVATKLESPSPAVVVAPEAATAPAAAMVSAEPAKKASNDYLICKASRHRFHYDWSASSLTAGEGAIDQNNVRYEFRSALKPAGLHGENLKVGECGWAAEALAPSKSEAKKHQQVVFKSLSDEATQTFYKMKTGKVFKVSVKQTKNGLVAAPGGVSVIR